MNKVMLIGTIAKDAEFSHSTGNEKFYSLYIDVTRSSKTVDTLNIIISDRLIVSTPLAKGMKVEVIGQYRSFSKRDAEGHRSLQLFVFVKQINVLDKADESIMDVNEVELTGNIERCFECRHTKTQRDVIDFTFKVARDYSRYDYLSCIAWGRNALYIKDICGEEHRCDTLMRIKGRLQSRVYRKNTYADDGVTILSYETRTVYELSVNDLEVINGEAEAEEETLSENVNAATAVESEAPAGVGEAVEAEETTTEESMVKPRQSPLKLRQRKLMTTRLQTKALKMR